MLNVQDQMAAQSRMEGKRYNFENLWLDAARLYLPRQAEFQMQFSTQGEDRNADIFDDYGIGALNDGKSIAISMLMPRGQITQRLTASDPELMKLQHVRLWFERLSQRLDRHRMMPESGFVQQSDESMASLLAFGNQAMTVEMRYDPRTRRAVGLRYRSDHIGQLFIEKNYQGLVSRLHRKFKMSAADALRRWGAELEKAPQVMQAARGDAKQQAREFEFLYVITDNPDIVDGRADKAGKAYLAGFISCADKEWVAYGGTDSRETIYSRYNTAPSEDYGRGPGIDVLGTMKSLQALAVDLEVGAEMTMMPPLGGPDDSLDLLINYGAGEFTPGAVSRRGDMLVQPLFKVGDGQWLMASQAEKRAQVDRAFFRNLLLTGQGDAKTHVTDTQLYLRDAEKGMLLAPLAMQETEWLTPMLDRELYLLSQLGEMDDMPNEVAEAGGAMQTVYDNPLSRARKAEAAGGYFMLAKNVAELGPLIPEIPQKFTQMYPMEKVLPGLADIHGVPEAWAATKDELEAKQQEQAQRQSAQDMLAIAQQTGATAKDFAQAEALAGA